jgi:hypothetical protein
MKYNKDLFHDNIGYFFFVLVAVVVCRINRCEVILLPLISDRVA